MKTRKIITISLFLSIIGVLFGVFFLAPTQGSPDEAILIRAKGDVKVYLIHLNKKYWIRTPAIFNSYGYNWKRVHEVPVFTVDNIPETNLIRTKGDIKVYVINEKGYKRHIPSPAVFKSYNYNWEDVVEVNKTESNYFPESKLIRAEGDYKVYYIEENKKRWIDSAETFQANGLDWNEVVVVNSIEIGQYPAGNPITDVSTPLPPTETIPPTEETATTTPSELPPTETATTTPSEIPPTETATSTPVTEPEEGEVPEEEEETPVPPSGGGGDTPEPEPTPPVDIIAPATVNDLTASNPTASSIDLSWTAPGDDSTSGIAASYDVRYFTDFITESNWDSATQVTNEPTPLAAGSSESLTVTDLSNNTTYYFVLKTSDEASNVSGLSNVVNLATPDVTAPAAITNLTASNPTVSSIDLSWTAPGDNEGSGTAASYDIRYSTASITESNWDSATQVSSEPTPALAGLAQSITVSNLNWSTTYYFAIKTSDEVLNESGLSNVVNLATKAPEECARPIASGKRSYYVSTQSQPQIMQIDIDPLDVKLGATQIVTVKIRDTNENPITLVSSTGYTDSSSVTFSLSLIAGSQTNGTWEGSWSPQDIFCDNYQVGITATSASGQSRVVLTFR